MSVQSVNVEVSREPRRSEPDGDLVLERSDLSDDVRKLDQDILGYDRSIDLEFLAGDRPLFIAKRGTETVGYAFGPGEVYNGPIGARDAADLIPIVAQLESVAAEQGRDEFRLSVPMAASGLVRWLMENGYRIDPFYEMLLTDNATISFERYVLTQPNFIW